MRGPGKYLVQRPWRTRRLHTRRCLSLFHAHGNGLLGARKLFVGQGRAAEARMRRFLEGRTRARLDWQHYVDSEKELRDFGLITGALLAFLFGLLLPWFKGYRFPFWPWIFCAALCGPALLHPRALKYPYAAWKRFGSALGWINSRVILTAIFLLVIVPIGLLLRLFTGDPMERKFDPDVPSYRVPSRRPSANSMERPF